MLQAFLNIFRIPELRNKLAFTIAMLGIYRIGFWIPLSGVDQSRLQDFFERQSTNQGAAGKLAIYISTFTGGNKPTGARRRPVGLFPSVAQDRFLEQDLCEQLSHRQYSRP